MPSYTTPDGITFTYQTLEEKIRILESMGIPYTPTAEELQDQTTIQTLKEEYQIMLARLNQIQNAGQIPFTQAGFNQVVQAVKDEALYLERIMRLLRRILT